MVTKVNLVRTSIFILGLTSTINANPLGGLINSVGTFLSNEETFSKCPGLIPDSIGDCVPVHLYNKPCVGLTTSGDLLPPCSGSNGRRNYQSNTSTNTNNIVINITSDNRIEVEKPTEKPSTN